MMQLDRRGSAMDLTQTHTYDAPLDAVLDMFADRDAIIDRYAGMGHRDIAVTACERTGDAIRTATSRVVEVDLPGFAKKVLSPTNTMQQTDAWNRNGDTWTGTFAVEVKGAPVRISGTMKLAGTATTTEHTVTIKIDVKVPLIGGKIADWMGKNDAKRTLEEEFAAGDRWLKQ